jgi:hypothetical protein
MSGKKIGQWVIENWPMDIYATIIFGSLLLWGCSLYYFRRNPEIRDIVMETLWWIGSRTARLTGFVLASPWLVFRGLFFAKNGGDYYKFAPIKTMFLLASFVMVCRLGTAGMALEGVTMGPDVEAQQKKAPEKEGKQKAKRRGRGGKTLRVGYRPMVAIEKMRFSNIEVYELLVLLIFCGMYYYRRDLKEGDQGDGLDSVLGFMWKAYAMKMSGSKWRDFESSSAEESPREEEESKKPEENIGRSSMTYQGEGPPPK